jgi:hypothetical protein
VNNEADIRFVDAEAERDRRNYYLDLVLHPLFLYVDAFHLGEFGVEEITFDLIISLQGFSKLFTVFA